MEKSEETRQWIDDLIFKLQSKSFNGRIILNFSQGGITGIEAYQTFKNLGKISLLD